LNAVQVTNLSRLKVLIFDSWTEGARLSLPDVGEAAEGLGVELVLLHLGSWGHDPQHSGEGLVGKIKSRDISWYDGQRLHDALDAERPDAVVFLSTTALAHRAFNRLCRQRAIPTAHLYHGFATMSDLETASTIGLDIRQQIRRIAARGLENATRIIPAYLRALRHTDARPGEYLTIITDIWRKLANTSYAGRAPDDAATDIVCVYCDAEREHAVHRYGVPIDRVHATGNLDLPRFGVLESDIGCYRPPDTLRNRSVMYLDTALTESGACFASHGAFVRHLTETAGALARQGFSMKLRLHPAHDRNGVRDAVAAAGFEVCERDQLKQALGDCEAVIAEPTTAAMVPALIGVPILLAQYGPLSGLRFGKPLREYPRSLPLTKLQTFKQSMDDRDWQRREIGDWTSRHAGPLPATARPERIFALLRDLRQSRCATGR
jgi:hypothetical protein